MFFHDCDSLLIPIFFFHPFISFGPLSLHFFLSYSLLLFFLFFLSFILFFLKSILLSPASLKTSAAGSRKPGSSWRGHLPKADSRARSKLPLGAQTPPKSLGLLRLSAVVHREAAGKEGGLSPQLIFPSAALRSSPLPGNGAAPLISLDRSVDYSEENRKAWRCGPSAAVKENGASCGIPGAAAVGLILSGR